MEDSGLKTEDSRPSTSTDSLSRSAALSQSPRVMISQSRQRTPAGCDGSSGKRLTFARSREKSFTRRMRRSTGPYESKYMQA